jgi:hypothetical protein
VQKQTHRVREGPQVAAIIEKNYQTKPNNLIAIRGPVLLGLQRCADSSLESRK